MRSRLVLDIQVGLIALALALLVAVFVFNGTYRDTKHTRDTIEVTGSAKMPIEADLAQWHLSVSADAATAGPAAREVEREVARAYTFLRKGGIADGAVTLPPASIDAYRVKIDKQHFVDRASVTQSLEIQTPNIDAVERLGRDVNALVASGISLHAERIAYISTQLTKARIRALDAATTDARHRAETIVTGLGGKLGRLRRAQLGVYQVTPRFSTEISDYGINDTSSRDKDVTAVVTVTFELRR